MVNAKIVMITIEHPKIKNPVDLMNVLSYKSLYKMVNVRIVLNIQELMTKPVVLKSVMIDKSY